jgi:hypothetical protein
MWCQSNLGGTHVRQVDAINQSESVDYCEGCQKPHVDLTDDATRVLVFSFIMTR